MTARETAALAGAYGRLEAAERALESVDHGAVLTASEQIVIHQAREQLRQVRMTVFERIATSLTELECVEASA